MGGRFCRPFFCYAGLQLLEALLCKKSRSIEGGFQVLTESVKTQIRDYRVERKDKRLESRDN